MEVAKCGVVEADLRAGKVNRETVCGNFFSQLKNYRDEEKDNIIGRQRIGHTCCLPAGHLKKQGKMGSTDDPETFHRCPCGQNWDPAASFNID